MDLKFSDAPKKIPLKDHTSELGQAMSSVHQWAREVSLAVRAINKKVSEVSPSPSASSGAASVSNSTAANTIEQVTTSGFSGRFADLEGLPTTLRGYGINDAQPKNDALTGISSLATTSFGRGLLAESSEDTLKTTLALNNVENTALSTWAGSTNLTTLGTIATGVWHGTAITDTYISSAATWNAKQSAISFGTGVQSALGVNIGAAGAPVLFNGALGTPTSGTLTNCTFPTLNQNTSGTAAGLSATLAVTSGGTGLASVTASRLLWSTGANTIGGIALGYGMNVTSSELRTPQDLQTTASPQFSAVGIGTSATGYRLVVNGDAVCLVTGGGYGPNFYLKAAPAGGYDYLFGSTGTSDSAGPGKFVIQNYTTGAYIISIDSTNLVSFLGALKTAPPSGGTSKPWKLGNYTAGIAVQAGKVRVEINGTPYDLLTA